MTPDVSGVNQRSSPEFEAVLKAVAKRLSNFKIRTDQAQISTSEEKKRSCPDEELPVDRFVRPRLGNEDKEDEVQLLEWHFVKSKAATSPVSSPSTLTTSSSAVSGPITVKEDTVVDPSIHFQPSNLRLRRLIRRSGEGKVTLIEQKTTSTLYCLKTVKKPYAINEEPWESYVLAAIPRHPNLINIEHTLYAKSGPYPVASYILPYFSLGDLTNLAVRFATQDKLIPEAFILSAFAQLAGAVEFLHRGFYLPPSSSRRQRLLPTSPHSDPGILHRDIKPENILVRISSKGRRALPDVVLTDFGHASFNQFTYDACGTYAYNAPEYPRSSPKGDIWGVGAVIHYLIHCQPPILPLPSRYLSTPEVQGWWEQRSEAKGARQDVPKGHSWVLIKAMLKLLAIEERKRPLSKAVVDMMQRDSAIISRRRELFEEEMPEFALNWKL